MKHGMLGAAKRATSRAFVKPNFYFDIHAFQVANLSIPFITKLQDGLNANELREVLQHLSLVASLACQCSMDWCVGNRYVTRAKAILSAAKEASKNLQDGWEMEFSLELARRDHRFQLRGGSWSAFVQPMLGSYIPHWLLSKSQYLRCCTTSQPRRTASTSPRVQVMQCVTS
jgi:hypothetical protein